MGLIARSFTLTSITMLALIPMAASAEQVAFTDLGAGNSFQTDIGYTETGPAEGVLNYSQGMEFTSLATGKLSTIDMALNSTNVSSSQPVDVYLTSSLPTSPSNISNILENYSLTSLSGSTSNLLSLTSLSNPLLTQGDNYYLTVVGQGSDFGAWQWNNQGVSGNVIVSNQGGDYSVGSNQTLSAFSVTVSAPAVPEVSSFTGLALMSLGSTLVLRRKRRV